MSLFLCWIVFPVVLVAVMLGCGLLVETGSGLRLPGVLILPIGLALVIVAAGLATAVSATAQLATPLVVGLALAGFGVSYPWRRRVDGWVVAAALGVFCVYAAPIVLSGAATFAGYQTLDDTATWLALADNAMTHGRSVSQLAPSTYQQVLSDYLPGGVPLGAQMPLGVGGQLTGQDVAWLFQPTLALLAASLGLSIYGAASRLIASSWLRAVTAFLGAQPALLFAYALWAGLKELAAAALIALVCVLVPLTFNGRRSWRELIPVALAAAALLGVLTPAGAVWLIIPAVASIIALAQLGIGRGVVTAGRTVVAIGVFAIPSLLIGYEFIHGAVSDELTSSSETANLGHPLRTLQLFGIWPATDFRLNVHDQVLTYVLIGVLCLSAAVAVGYSVRRRALSLPLYALTAVGGTLIVIALRQIGLSSPWLVAKAMAEGSPALVAIGVAGAAVAFETGRRTEGSIMLLAIATGVLFSNGLAYSNAWLAPRSQLAELQTIAQLFPGEGPTLMTEYQPYGVRHFLRGLDPEAASERRRRVVPLLDGSPLTPGDTADLDAFQTIGILEYRTLVLCRSPVESRPPSVYRLIWSGRFYEVWQRPTQAATILEHLGLGTSRDPAAIPSCTAVLDLASRASAAGGTLAVVRRPQSPVVLDLDKASFPVSWSAADNDGTVVPHGGGDVAVTTRVPVSGRYKLWLAGSFRRTITTAVDGQRIGSVDDQLNNKGQWTPLGATSLTAGTHQIVLHYGGSRLAPGHGGLPFGMGPLALGTTTAALPVEVVAPSAARSLCGQRLDWVEALSG